ncbi:hypothetical protein PVK06_019846 [Gossypium arboreum]|uniref:Uncharacterized protein n=3 Tax=Gossypium TaxID=3633 RepID=A0ABR0PL34_GOSAR|nr:hypothetical protein PVK06_019846 [Gossypium arboreum]
MCGWFILFKLTLKVIRELILGVDNISDYIEAEVKVEVQAQEEVDAEGVRLSNTEHEDQPIVLAQRSRNSRAYEPPINSHKLGVYNRRRELPKYAYELLELNYPPVDNNGELVLGQMFQTKGGTILASSFWLFRPLDEGFKQCKPIVKVDCTFLYGWYNEKLIVVVSQGGARKTIPLASALVKQEARKAFPSMVVDIPLTTMAASMSTLMVVLVAVCALMGSAIAADAPAPSPTSGAGSISPSFVSVSVAAAAVALLFGSRLRI